MSGAWMAVGAGPAACAKPGNKPSPIYTNPVKSNSTAAHDRLAGSVQRIAQFNACFASPFPAKSFLHKQD